MSTDIATVYDAVRAVATELLSGSVVQIDDVTAGRGSVIDWRTARSGEPIVEGGDAFDVAYQFVLMVGPRAALDALTEDF